MPGKSLIGWVVTQFDTHYPAHGPQVYGCPIAEWAARDDCASLRAHTDGVMRYDVARLWLKGGSRVLEMMKDAEPGGSA